jgi:uncharacterized protein YodC (DUF2158 family)
MFTLKGRETWALAPGASFLTGGNMDELKVGWIVQLISGGPVMTVSKVAEGYVECIWFNGAERMGPTPFHKDTLIKK